MENLLNISVNLVHNVSTHFTRSMADRISWRHPLIGIKGARGVGKTTLLLQHLRHSGLPNTQKLYVSLDEMYFTEHSLLEMGERFAQQGGQLLALDEVHKYPSWAREIKNLHDRYADLQIIYTGSSILDMAQQEGDLSRRALMYELSGLSFREFLDFKHGIKLPILTLEQILSPDFSGFDVFPSAFKPYQFFDSYLRTGYYPFAKGPVQDYYRQLRQLVRMVVEYDMAEVKGFDIRQAKKLLQLLFIIAQQAPFKPNLSRLSQRTNIHRNSINNYLYYLEEAKLLSLLQHKNYSVSALQKPEKIFLENTNLIYALSHFEPNIGTIREVFFYNQLNTLHQINQAPRADFLVDEKYTFEVGGKSKQSQQIRGLQNAWLVKDNIEHKVAEAIPLWLFGFLY